jgi:tRNA(His) 5'-end guanylyltransferase
MKNDLDTLGNRLKAIEMQEAGRKMMPELPVIARLDGRAFHTYTRGMHRPYDSCMQSAMAHVTCALVEEFHAAVGYTQSDEITLVWREPTLFDGRFQKLTSVLAGYCSASFVKAAQLYLPEKDSAVPCFDCRVFQVPNLQAALDVLAWREADAVKNSVAMAAQSYFFHKQLQGKHRGQMMDMLFLKKGVNWNDYPAQFKRGIYVKRTVVERTLTDAERSRIPAKHRPPADQKFKRGQTTILDIPPIRQLLPDVAIHTLFSKTERE